ncbi:putative vesicle transport protein [Paratrimastix pyriformis]|uniref:Vesicle transport protein n=1 Tax=Paratrimastix pyriformis TaxID=342808 RepID=A0ABQ8UVP5_9EUKA|nr:putative vesicle transport protein [Paratrimastix pyriformis]
MASTPLQSAGLGCTLFGLGLIFLGILLLFDSILIAMGDVLFLVGVALTVGLKGTLRLFTQPEKKKIMGTACFFFGVLLVFLRWPIFGLGFEIFGSVYLFGQFLPVIITKLLGLPFSFIFTKVPGLSTMLAKIASSDVLPGGPSI